MVTVNDLQTLFTIIFGIYFATTVGTSGRFWFFDSTAAMGGDWRAVARLVLGFIGLNLLPFAYFMGVLWWLEPRCIGLLDAPLASLGVLFAGLGGFGIYRIFLGLVLMRRRGSRRELLFYSAPADLAKHYLSEGAKSKQPPDDALAYPWYVVSGGGLAWLTVCIALFWCLTK